MKFKFKDEWYYYIALGVGVMVGLGLFLDMYDWSKERECKSNWEISKYVNGSCIVLHNDHWLPAENIRVIKWIEEDRG